MKKRITAFALTLVLIIGTFSTGVLAATQTEVDTEITSTATYLAGALSEALTIDNYREVFLVAASNIDATDLLTEYVKIVKSTPSSTFTLTQYGGAIMALVAGGFDPTNLEGRNLVTEFSDALNSPTNSSFFSDYSSGEVSPFLLTYMISSMNQYKDEIKNATKYLESSKAAIMDYYDFENSYFDNWGGNSDNDSKLIVGLKSFYDAGDSEIVKVTNTALSSIKSTIDSNYQSINCGATSVYPDPYLMSGANPSSTGLSLLAFSTFGNQEADNLFNGLLSFKVTGTTGAYHSAFSEDADPVYSTPDALEGLLAYSRMISGGDSIYDLNSYSSMNSNLIIYISIAALVIVGGVFVFILRKKLFKR